MNATVASIMKAVSAYPSIATIGPQLLHDVTANASFSKALLVIVDGLGHANLLSNAAVCPTLARLAAPSRPARAAVPATTAVGVTALGTGLEAGAHGLIGFSMRLQPDQGLFCPIHWGAHAQPTSDLREAAPPESVQPNPTVLERARRRGLRSVVIGPNYVDGSGFTRAALRGAEFVKADDLDSLLEAVVSLTGQREGQFVYAYHAALDRAGHDFGLMSQQYFDALRAVDTFVAALIEMLPPGVLAVITADHGMIDLPPRQLVDVDDHPALRQGVKLVGGEARCRYLYLKPGESDLAVAARWQNFLGPAAHVLTRAPAVASGLFGEVRPPALLRLGDVVVLSEGPIGVSERKVLKAEAEMAAHHGGLSEEELLVPQLLLGRK